jgi:murein L,D-transpeptidase YcbB/YkuD
MEDKGCVSNQLPLVFPADNPMKLIVLYSTVWYDRNRAIGFYDDVYAKN